MNAYARHVVISSRSKYPLYLYRHNGKVVLKDAIHMSGFIAYEVMKGLYAGLKLDAFEANTVFTFGSRCDVADAAVPLKGIRVSRLLSILWASSKTPVGGVIATTYKRMNLLQ